MGGYRDSIRFASPNSRRIVLTSPPVTDGGLVIYAAAELTSSVKPISFARSRAGCGAYSGMSSAFAARLRR